MPLSIPFLLRGDFRTCIPSYPQIQSPPGAPWSLPAGTEDGHAPRLGISDAAPVRTAAQPPQPGVVLWCGSELRGSIFMSHLWCFLQVRQSLHSFALRCCFQVHAGKKKPKLFFYVSWPLKTRKGASNFQRNRKKRREGRVWGVRWGLRAAISGLCERASVVHGSGYPLCGAPIDTNSEQ